jgi:hypothetical protein
MYPVERDCKLERLPTDTTVTGQFSNSAKGVAAIDFISRTHRVYARD